MKGRFKLKKKQQKKNKWKEKWWHHWLHYFLDFHQTCTELENMWFIGLIYLVFFWISSNLHYTCKIKKKTKRCSGITWWCERFILLNQTHKDAHMWVAVLLCVFTLSRCWRWACVWKCLVASFRSWPKLQHATKAAEVPFCWFEYVGVQMTTTRSQPCLLRTLPGGPEIAHASMRDSRLIVFACVTEQQLLLLDQ